MDESVKTFTKATKRLTKVYEQKERLTRRIAEKEAELENVSSSWNFGAVRNTPDQSRAEYRRLSLYEKKDALEQRYNACVNYIKWISNVIGACSADLRNYMIEKYVLRRDTETLVSEMASLNPATRVVKRMDMAVSEDLRRVVTPERIAELERIEAEMRG